MARPVEPLSEKHRIAIELLTSTPRIRTEETTKILGISRMTLWRWRKRPDFASEVKRIKLEQSRRLMRSGKRNYSYGSDELAEILRYSGLLR